MGGSGAMPGRLRGLVQGLRFLAALLLVALLLAACGGGGGSPGDGDDKLSPGAGNGSLSVVIRGLPPGVPAAVRVTGPGEFTAELRQSQDLVNLAPGAYEVAAAVVASGTGSFTPDPARQSVQVAGDAAASATVTYSASFTVADNRPVHKFGRSSVQRG